MLGGLSKIKEFVKQRELKIHIKNKILFLSLFAVIYCVCKNLEVELKWYNSWGMRGEGEGGTL